MIESKLIKAIIKKDEKAFEKLYHQYYRLIYYVIFQIVRHDEDTKELVQDVFFTVYQKISDYRGGNFKYWMVSIAKNLAKNHVSRVIFKQKHIIKNDNLVHHIKDEKDQLFELDDLLDHYFDKEIKEIIILKVVFDYSFKKIAHEMDLSVSYVFRSYKASIKTLKLIMEVV